MNKKITVAIIASFMVLVIGLGYWYCYVPDFSAYMALQTNYAAPYKHNEQICETFFRENMVSSQFEIYTNYLESDEKGALATGHDVLSESYGLLMMRAVKQGNRALFDQCYNTAMQQLWTGEILSWRKNSQTKTISPVNAAVDDLRIIQALILGYQVWKDKTLYRKARSLAIKLYRHNVRGKYFVDTYDAQTKLQSANATLCYQNFLAFRMLSKIDFRWKKVYQNALETVQQGYLGDTLPLYQTRKNLNTDAYETEEINTVESLLTVLHLAEVGQAKPATISWIWQNVAQGTLFIRYDKNTGRPTTEYQSTAAYAICAIIGATMGDELLYQAAVEHMNRYQVQDPSSKIFGSYGNAVDESVFSFDNLYALLAFCC